MKMEQRTCLESIPIQLFDRNIHLQIKATIIIRNPNHTSIHTPKPTFPDHQGSAKPSRRRFHLGERENAQIVSPALSQELVERDRVGEVSRLGVKLGPPRVHTAGSDAERTSPRDLRRSRDGGGADVSVAVFVVPPLTVGEMEALHCRRETGDMDDKDF